MAWSIRFEDRAQKDLVKLDPQVRRRLLLFLQHRVLGLEHPKQLGKPLKGNDYEGLWSYRVGDYRLICSFEEDALLILVAPAGHRRDIYQRLAF